VFTRSGPGWRQAAELTASDGVSGDALGQSVAISPDGSRVVAGAMSRDNFRGALYVFTGPGWRQQSELTASDPAVEDFFGWSVATSSAGDEVLAGAVGHNAPAGAVYVFTRRGRSWHQTAELTGTGSGSLGWSVAVSPTGTTVAAGAVGNNSQTGAVYVFTRRGTAWSQQAELTATVGTAFDLFGKLGRDIAGRRHAAHRGGSGERGHRGSVRIHRARDELARGSRGGRQRRR
jgi:hypothetical protein